MHLAPGKSDNNDMSVMDISKVKGEEKQDERLGADRR
jgi:hypothetical protein